MKFRQALTLTVFFAGFTAAAEAATSLATASELGSLALLALLAFGFLGLAMLQRKKPFFSLFWG